MTHLEARDEDTRDDYETPWYIVRAIEARLGITFALDAAAAPETAKAPRFFTESDSGLVQPWEGPTWLNPPYGDAIPKWMGKAAQEGHRGVVVAIPPARTDTVWWHECVMAYASEVWLVKGRIRFLLDGVVQGSPKFPSAVVIYRPGHAGEPRITAWTPPHYVDERQAQMFEGP